MAQIIFRGAILRSYNVKNGANPTTTGHFRADWTEPAAESMKWDAPGNGWGKCDLKGQVACSNVIITPNGDLAVHEKNIAASMVTKFKHVPILDGEEHVKEHQISFDVIFTGDVDIDLGQFARAVKLNKCQLVANLQQMDIKDAIAANGKKK